MIILAQRQLDHSGLMELQQCLILELIKVLQSMCIHCCAIVCKKKYRCVLPFSCKCTAGLYVPGVVFDGAQGEVFGDFCCRHTVLHILLVGKYQHSCFAQVLREEDGAQ